MARSLIATLAVLLVVAVSMSLAATGGGLNVLRQFSAYSITTFSSSNADNQGRLAAAGNITLVDYEVGTLLPKDCTRADIIGGQAISLYNVEVGHGSVVYGTTLSSTFSGLECGSARNPTYLPFSTLSAELRNDSQAIGATPANAPTVLSSTDLQLQGKSAQNNIFSVSASQFSSARSIHIDVPLNAWATINVGGTVATFASLQITLSSTTVLEKVLFNFYQATSLNIYAISVAGSVLAPNAVVQFDNGNIDGSIAAYSINGTGEIHLHPYIPPACTCPACPPQYALPTWSIFARTTVNQSNTDDEGQFAAGGNVYLHDYAIGSNLTNSFGKRTDMVVGGSLVFDVGQIYYGNALVGGSATLTNVGVPNGVVYQQATIPINFNSTFQQLIGFSRALSQMTPTGSVVLSGGVLTITGTNPDLNIFNMPANPGSFSSTVISAPAGSWVIVNFAGSSGQLTNGNMVVSGTTFNQVIYNFFEAKTMKIDSISVAGGVLAPSAATTFTNGNINGCLWVDSLQGNGETHNFPPPPFTPPCPPCNC